MLTSAGASALNSIFPQLAPRKQSGQRTCYTVAVFEAGRVRQHAATRRLHYCFRLFHGCKLFLKRIFVNTSFAKLSQLDLARDRVKEEKVTTLEVLVEIPGVLGDRGLAVLEGYWQRNMRRAINVGCQGCIDTLVGPREHGRVTTVYQEKHSPRSNKKQHEERTRDRVEGFGASAKVRKERNGQVRGEVYGEASDADAVVKHVAVTRVRLRNQ